MPLFLSSIWFEEVERLRDEVGELEVPESLRALVVNVVVTGHPEGDKELHVAAGDFRLGLAEDAPTSVTLSFDVAKGMFTQAEQGIVLQAFLSGEIRIDGDVAPLMQMQTLGDPGDKLRELQVKVKEMTEI